MNKPMTCPLLVAFLCLSTFSLSAADDNRITLLRTPDGGIQPQCAVDAQGTMHLIYYKGEAGAGDIFYVKQIVTGSDFSKAIQVNSQRGSAFLQQAHAECQTRGPEVGSRSRCRGSHDRASWG